MSKYTEFDWPFEISGMGGGYEADCRYMTMVAVKWLRNNPTSVEAWVKAENTWKEKNPDSTYYPSTIYPKSYDDFDRAVTNACPECTGAMFGAAVSHARYIYANGWDNYVQSVLDARKKRKKK